jgi:hypothetical protein
MQQAWLRFMCCKDLPKRLGEANPSSPTNQKPGTPVTGFHFWWTFKACLNKDSKNENRTLRLFMLVCVTINYWKLICSRIFLFYSR